MSKCLRGPVQNAVSPLDGAYNFRDLGGLPTADGRCVRRGLLYRSDTLQALTPQDVAFLRDTLTIRLVIDLRLFEEASEEGRGLLSSVDGLTFVNTPLEMASLEGVSPNDVMRHLYSRCLASGSLPVAVERIAEHAGSPTIFHCAAGKDRTGIVAALVLDLLGVTDEAIVEDYLATSANMPRIVARFENWPRYRDHLRSMPPEVYAVQAAPIIHLLTSVRSAFGSTKNWALDQGISEETLTLMRRILLEKNTIG